MSDEDNHLLPCDVKIGHITFRKGCKLSTLTDRARAWHEMSKSTTLSHTKQAEILRQFDPKE